MKKRSTSNEQAVVTDVVNRNTNILRMDDHNSMVIVSINYVDSLSLCPPPDAVLEDGQEEFLLDLLSTPIRHIRYQLSVEDVDLKTDSGVFRLLEVVVPANSTKHTACIYNDYLDSLTHREGQ